MENLMLHDQVHHFLGSRQTPQRHDRRPMDFARVYMSGFTPNFARPAQRVSRRFSLRQISNAHSWCRWRACFQEAGCA